MTEKLSSEFFDILAGAIAVKVLDRVDQKLWSNPVDKMLYDVDEAAVYLGRSVSAVRKLIERREVPIVKIGARVQVHRRDMDELIEKARG
jgi:excisionase family DNA binding protein